MMDDKISMLEDRITALEKLLKLVTLPDKNAILSELLNDAHAYIPLILHLKSPIFHSGV